ncbi:MAG: phosphatase PAP2 family protein [Candidatus Acidiferrum sp.]
MKPAIIVRLALSLILLNGILYLCSARFLFIGTLDSPFFSIALLSLFFILVRTSASLREFLATLLLFTVLAALEFRLLGYPSTWPVWVSLLGMASLGVLFLRLVWAPPSQRRLAAFVLIPSLLFVVSEWFASLFLFWTERFHPKVLDLYLYSFDASTRIQLPFLMGRLFLRFPALSFISVAAYIGLPVAIGLAFAGCVLRNPRTALAACVAFLITGPVGILFYNLFPALGPVHLFEGRFPWDPLSLQQARHLFLEPVPLAGARNAIPSLHAAWIFLVFWYTRDLSRLEKTIAALFVVFTLFATLGTGEHYFVDLVVAVPFSLLILAFSNLLIGHQRFRQLFPLGIGLAGVLVWLMALQYAPLFFWRSPLIPWLACSVTVAACYLAVKKVDGPSRSQPAAELCLNSEASQEFFQMKTVRSSVPPVKIPVTERQTG